MGFYVEYDPNSYKPKPKPDEREERLGAVINLGFSVAAIVTLAWLVVMILRAVW